MLQAEEILPHAGMDGAVSPLHLVTALDDAAVLQDVVADEHTARRHQSEDVRQPDDILCLRRIHKNKIEALPLLDQTVEQCTRIPRNQRDVIPVRTAREVPRRRFDSRRVALHCQQLRLPVAGLCHAEGGVADRRTDLQDPLRLKHPHETLKKRRRFIPDNRDFRCERFCSDGFKKLTTIRFQ